MRKKLNEVLAEKMGEEKANVLLKVVSDMSDNFATQLQELVTKFIESTKSELDQLLANPEYDDHRDYILDLMRKDVFVKLTCDTLTEGASLQAMNPIPCSDLAQHMLSHYEEALVEAQRQSLAIPLASLVDALRDSAVPKPTEGSAEGETPHAT